MTDARWAVIVMRELEATRIATDPLLKEARLTRHQVSDPDAKIPFYKHAAILTLAAEATGDGCLALNLSLRMDPRQAGALGYVLLNSTTLGEALTNWQRYLHVMTEGWEVDLENEGENVAIVGRMMVPLGAYERQVAEGAASVTLQFCELITGKNIAPTRIEFRHSKPKEAQIIRRRFGCPVRYRQNRMAIILKRELLNYPVKEPDNELLKILKRYCRQVIEEQPRTRDLAFEVRQVITELLPSGQPSMDDVARKFSMSSRTLRRRLADEGLIYKEVVDDVRQKLASIYVSDERIHLKEVAYLLGYSDVAAFINAFRRWTGLSPGEYRRKAR